MKEENTKYSAWMPITDIRTLRVLGKAAEETAELNKALCRAIIQGLDGIDPHTGKDNRTAIMEEMADVSAQQLLLHRFLETSLDEQLEVAKRSIDKYTKLLEWQEGLLDNEHN